MTAHQSSCSLHRALVACRPGLHRSHRTGAASATAAAGSGAGTSGSCVAVVVLALACARRLLVHDDDDAAVEPAALAAQRRVAEGPSRQLARRRGGALLLQLEGPEEGRPAADDSAERCLACPSGCEEAGSTPLVDGRRRSSLSSHIRWAVRGCGRERGRSSAGARRSSSRSSAPRSTTHGSSRTSRGSITRGPSAAFYPGRYEPPNAPVRGPMSVPDDQRWRLLATFNGGFIYRDGQNGSSIGGSDVRAAEGRARDDDRLPRRPRRHQDLDRRPGGGPKDRVRAAEPAADRRPRPPQPGARTTARSGATPSATRCACGAPEPGSTATAT